MLQQTSIKTELPQFEQMANNQLIVKSQNWSVYYSYGVTIAAHNLITGKTYLDRSKFDCSKTTAKYRNQFLNVTTKQMFDKIENKEIELVKLN